MSIAIELFHQDGHSSGIFYCSECRIVHKTEAEAQACHGVILCECGNPRESYRTICSACQTTQWLAESERKEEARFEKATKISASEYDGEHVHCGDEYYDSVEDAIDQFLEGQEPDYVWACKTRQLPSAQLEWLTDTLVEEMWEDAEVSDLNGVPELETAIDAFNKANESLNLWEPDYRTAILVSRETK